LIGDVGEETDWIPETPKAGLRKTAWELCGWFCGVVHAARFLPTSSVISEQTWNSGPTSENTSSFGVTLQQFEIYISRSDAQKTVIGQIN
jgi:hypothetical protein